MDAHRNDLGCAISINVRDAQKMILNISWRPRNCAALRPDAWPPQSPTSTGETMLDFIGTMATGALMVLVVAALAVTLKASDTSKLAFAAIAGLWIGFAAASAQAGWIAIGTPFPPHRLVRCRAPGSRGNRRGNARRARPPLAFATRP